MNPALARFLGRLGFLRPDHLRILVRADRVRIETPLLVECAGSSRHPIKFIIDSGCSVTTLDLARAQALGMPTQGRRVPKPRTGSMGTRTINVVQSTFRFWLSADQRAAAFVAPIEFEENQPAGVPALFGLKGIIDQLRWTIGPCKPPMPDVLGCCVLEDVRPASSRFPS
jgi:hypothetical protein